MRRLLPPDCTNFLSEYHMEAEGCWYFFPREDVEIPPERWTLRGLGIAIFKSGDCRLAYDFRPNEQKMQEYLEIMSLFALNRVEEARAAHDVFHAKWGEATD